MLMPPVLYHEQDGVATITLNRPDTFHSLSKELLYQLKAHLTTAEENTSVRCIVITATGKAFCSGQDLHEFEDVESIDFEEGLRTRYEPLIRQMRSLAKPVICGLNGVAAGAGASLALTCDVIIASEAAYMTLAFIHIGLIPDGGSTWFLPRIVGHHRAMGLMMTGDKVSAQQAYEWGWVYAVYPAEEYPVAIKKFASHMAQMPSKALAGIKHAVNMSYHNNLDAQLELERKLQGEAGQSGDFKEGIAAFLEKRRPTFK